MAEFLTVRFDTDKIFAALDAGLIAGEEVLPRVIAQAGAEYMVSEVRRKVQSLGRKTGNLYGSIYQAFSPENSGKGKSQYNVTWRTSKKSGLPRAPHGHWIEFGYMRRYQVRQRANGTWFTLRKAGKRHEVKPGRKASQAERDAFWVPRHGGPVFVPGQRFLRGTYETHRDRVIAHMLRRAQYEMSTMFGV